MCFVEERNSKIVGNGFSGVSGRDGGDPFKYQKVNGLCSLGGVTGGAGLAKALRRQGRAPGLRVREC